METETLTRDNLIQGEVETLPVTVGANQEIKRGDLLELSQIPVANTGTGAITVTAGASFVRPPAAANIFSIYVVALEPVTTGAGESATITAANDGKFDPASMRFGGSSTAADNRNVLAGKGILLATTVPV